jgi:sugar phosphate isomerase/epimerase
MESLEVSANRLMNAGIKFIELHGNHYGADLGYKPAEALRILRNCDITVAGVCGMFSAENDLSSSSGITRQYAIDYIKRTIDFTAEVGGSYILVVPGACGRPKAYDNMEFARSVETILLVADLFTYSGIKAAIEPIRAAEVSFCHTISDAVSYIEAINHPGIQHINGDVYHMQCEESHIGTAILEAGSRLTNLHMADSNRRALGDGSMDLDTLIRSLYTIGYNRPGCYVTPEPLGPGADPYPAMYGKPDAEMLDKVVQKTARYFREREESVLNEIRKREI